MENLRSVDRSITRVSPFKIENKISELRDDSQVDRRFETATSRTGRHVH